MSTTVEKNKINELKALLDAGTPLQEAFGKIGEDRTRYMIKELDSITVKSNTVGGCSLGDQYCGCEHWVK